jgi:two-component system sensor histidine kinase YesM
MTIITTSGNIIFYDKISGSSTNSSWLDSVPLTQDELYNYGMNDFNTKIIPTHPTLDLAGLHYSFHLIHRIIDYKDIEHDIGIVVLTLNEKLLSDVCNSEKTESSFGIITDSTGTIISYLDKTRIGTQLENNKIFGMIDHENNIQEKYISVYMSELLNGWKIYSVVNQSVFNKEVKQQIINVFVLGLIILVITSIIIVIITDLLSKSLKKVANAMREAENGNLSVSINKNDIYPIEMNTIAEAFNTMILRILVLIDKIKRSSSYQRDAEVKALEAQINPSFLYNILDNINRMAVEKEQQEISKMIVSLAKILHYSINQSNKTAKIEEEISWVKQYLYLQQESLKNNFTYSLAVDASILEINIYKLMFQTFIENAITHGFKDRENNILEISVELVKNIIIKIQDNGNGMSPAILGKIQEIILKYDDLQEEYTDSPDDYIGFMNAISRIKMYYGNRASIKIESKLNEGTTITIELSGIINDSHNY